MERAKFRGVTHIICPYRDGYFKYLSQYNGDMSLIWLPIAPRDRRAYQGPLSTRKHEVLVTGNAWPGKNGFRPYEFRRWAYEQEFMTKQSINAVGPFYQAMISQYAGALAACDCYVVPKYLEIPLAGCVCFCQMIPDYKEMGFEDGVNCIAVDETNLRDRIEEFKKTPEAYQVIADAGRQMALKYKAKEFAKNLETKLVKEQ